MYAIGKLDEWLTRRRKDDGRTAHSFAVLRNSEAARLDRMFTTVSRAVACREKIRLQPRIITLLVRANVGEPNGN